ncbi:phosphate ABC transporter permease PstA [Cylindrospermopsis raciborskii CHAB3438]|uniref:phosphate ABC transporter permease PstA n=1 Tax=Cylindrospermopsis raciborskii TaxID=77022 RepID=UPI0011416ABA|nr:phosphate ABC transporter permease PstA [Cylindrospermopsis raciborskii]MCH4904374.1 phosphate ABC transporter permease PstA [Cylindrospermopsis raciborskii CHAB3438]MEB3145448.1 phosphate ABC transporter permease PstA [Cylindrospermopsis raciborskii]TPX28629.1 phosphate ABC transporter permease PstA [Cylindrospermopsis raciborskii GIHE 2018]
MNSGTDESFARELLDPLPPNRLLFSYLMNGLSFILSLLAFLPLGSIIWEIISRGSSSLKLEMFYLPLIDNGFANAILGTLLMVSIATLLSVPVGVITGIFLAEFAKNSQINKLVRFLTSILTGVPSIVVGMFAYGVVVLTTKEFSALAGGFALSVIMLPVITLTTEEALKLVPVHQRLASAALGGTKLQTTFRIVVKSAIPGITTGVSLAIARAAGETAPLIFTALFSQNWSDGLISPTASLPVLIFNLYNSPDPKINQLVWTTSIILLSLVLFFSLLSRFLGRKSKLR